LPSLDPEFAWRLCGGVCRQHEWGIELDRTALHTLKQQIERHDLGQRGRMTQPVSIKGMQNFACIAIDNDRGRRRRICCLGAVNSRGLLCEMEMAASVCGVTGDHESECNARKP
jgi:hypothetical protein